MPAVKDVGEPCAGGSSRQGCDPAGESPATSVVHVGREATPHPSSGNRLGDAWCARPGGPACMCRGRSSLGAERVQEPEGDRMTAASIYGSPQKLLHGGKFVRRTRFPWGEAGVLGEGMDERSQGARRGMGPSTCTRVAEIMSGKAISQQGLAATCKDPTCKAQAEAWGGFWSGAWARMSYEGGVMPSQMSLKDIPSGGNAPGGQRSPGYSVAAARGHRGNMAGRQTRSNPSSQWTRSCASRPGGWGTDTGKPRGRGVYASQHLSFRTRGQARALANGVQSRDQNRTREIRPSGIVEGLSETWPVGVHSPCGARAELLSRQPHARIDVAAGGDWRSVGNAARTLAPPADPPSATRLWRRSHRFRSG